MCRFIKDILDPFNVLGANRVPPAYDMMDAVIRSKVTPIDFTFGIANIGTATLTYINAGNQVTDTYDVDHFPYARTVSVNADPNTDIVLKSDGFIVGIKIYEGTTFVAIPASSEGVLIPVSTLVTVDMRNGIQAYYSTAIEIPNNISRIYAKCNYTNERDILIAYINYSTCHRGIIWVNRSDNYANAVIAAAKAKGWRVRYL